MSPTADLSSLQLEISQPVPRFAELCRDDLERRWGMNQPVSVDAYFEQFPNLFEDTESSLLLIYSEYLLRERRGQSPEPDEFERRFPRFARELLAQFQLHAALGPDTPPDAEGDVDLYEEIGRGGMGVVLRGHDRILDRELAVKVLRPGRHEDRFLAEARICGQLQHPGIVPVHHVGRLADGQPYFTMKLVEGSTFATLLKDRPGQPEHLRTFESVCQAMAYAHERGVIHRDLKPANIMVGRFGEVQVMDWGLAKTIGSSDLPSLKGRGGQKTHPRRMARSSARPRTWPRNKPVAMAMPMPAAMSTASAPFSARSLPASRR